MSHHVFVDESKQKAYVMVAVAVATGHLVGTRSTARELLLPGLDELHMSKESDRRRRKIASAVVECAVAATVYVAEPHHDPRSARPACLDAIVRDAHTLGTLRLVFDRDESLVLADNRLLYAATKELGCSDILRYEHCSGRNELLLGLPDAIAWCWAKGGDWRRRVDRVITAVRHV